MIPKGYLFNCPYCGKPLYKVMKDVRMDEQVNDTIDRFVAIFPQPLVNHSSDIVQSCHYCKQEFNFLGLIKEYWRK